MRRASVIWFTGLSGSGKTTIAGEVSRRLSEFGKKIKIYDGDTVRKKTNKHLTFTPEHILENNRSIARMCLKDLKEYDCIFVPIISPFFKCRRIAKDILKDSFYLVYVKASIKKVMQRDPKGLYKHASAGRIKNFIGLDKKVPYQAPKKADLVLDTEKEDVESCADRLFRFVNSLCNADKSRERNNEK